METKTKFAVIVVALAVLAATGLQVIWRIWPDARIGTLIPDIQTADLFTNTVLQNNTSNTTAVLPTERMIEAVTVTPVVNDGSVVSLDTAAALPHSFASSMVTVGDQWILGWLSDNQYWIESYNIQSSGAEWVSQQPASVMVPNLPLVLNQPQRAQLVVAGEIVYVGWLTPRSTGSDYGLQLTKADQTTITLDGVTVLAQSPQYRFTVTAEHIIVAVAQPNQALQYLEFSLTGALLSQQTLVQSGSPISVTGQPDGSIVVVSQLDAAIIFTKLSAPFGRTVTQFAVPLNSTGNIELVDFARTPDYVVVLAQTADQSSLQVFSWTDDFTEQFQTLTIPGVVSRPYLATLDDATVQLGYDTATTETKDNTTVTRYTSTSLPLHLANGLLQ